MNSGCMIILDRDIEKRRKKQSWKETVQTSLYMEGKIKAMEGKLSLKDK